MNVTLTIDVINPDTIADIATLTHVAACEYEGIHLDHICDALLRTSITIMMSDSSNELTYTLKTGGEKNKMIDHTVLELRALIDWLRGQRDEVP